MSKLPVPKQDADKLTTADKMLKMRQLSAAIDKARDNLETQKTIKAARELQRLQRQRESLRATLPGLSVV